MRRGVVSFFNVDVVFEEFADEVGAAFGDEDSGLAALVFPERMPFFYQAIVPL